MVSTVPGVGRERSGQVNGASLHTLFLGFLGRTDRQDDCLMWENHPRRRRLKIHSFFFFETILNEYFSSVQFSSVPQLCPTLCYPMNCSTPGLPVHHQLQSSLKLMSIELVMLFSHLILCHPLLLLPSIFPSIRVFSNKSVLRIRWPKYWSFNFNISPSNEQPFRMYWLVFLAV